MAKKKIQKKQKTDTPPPVEPTSTPQEEIGMRLNKYVAHCGVCSRRKAAELVKAGSISVNGQVETAPGYLVQDNDQVSYQGKILQPEVRQVYLLLNKPKDTITTLSDEKGRRTVMDVVGNKIKERIFPVGRLDRETVGLLVLTNDGDLAKKLSHPSHEVKKVYIATLDKAVSPEDIEKIRKGLVLEDGAAPVDWVDYVNAANKKEVTLEIHIGRNRIVRRIFSHLGYRVVKLDRTYYAGLSKKDLPRGRYRHLTKQEVIMLKHFI